MQITTPELLTVTEIARRLNAPPHAVTYVIKTRKIRSNRWAGHARLFDEPAVERIQSELNRIRSATILDALPARLFDPGRCHGKTKSAFRLSKRGLLNSANLKTVDAEETLVYRSHSYH